MQIKHEETPESNYFFIKAEGKIYNIKYDDLLYAEAKGNVTKIVTNIKAINPYISFTDFHSTLPHSIFLRINRSFIINKSKINHIEGNRVFINNSEIPIGNSYREHFLNGMGL